MLKRLAAAALAVGLAAAACGDSGTETLPGGNTTTGGPEDTARVLGDPTTTTAPDVEGALQAPIATVDDLILESRTFPAGRDWVVLAHMRPADMSSWYAFGERLAEEGYTALAFNFRGYGDSEGNREPFAVETDVGAAIDFAFGRGAERVFVIGASMGGTGALVAAATRPVAGVATLSAPTTFFSADGLEAVPDIAAPKLFVAAEDDAPYPEAVADFLAAATEPKAERIFPGNAHGTDLFASHGEELTALLLDFLNNA